MTKKQAAKREAAMWGEYDAAAEFCARHGLKGEPGDQLPHLLGSDTKAAIDADPEAFQERVRATAYAIAMEKIEQEWGGPAGSNREDLP